MIPDLVVVKVWLPTTIEKSTEVAEKPTTSDAMSFTENVCGGSMSELNGGVEPVNASVPALKDSQAGNGLLSIRTA